MDKKDWKNSLELLENLLKKKNEELAKIQKDIEEIAYTIVCYKKKIAEIGTPNK
jgi:Skp family chaperone for outer membrane proteins